MDQRCLVLSGRLLGGQDAATVHARMAAAFGMEQSGFRERVFLRAPLIIRRGLDDSVAQSQAAQLREMGVEADVWPDSDRLVWLRRDGQVHGPLPVDTLDHYAQAGDQWCHDGGQTWFAWTAPAAVPPPLPATAADLHATHDALSMDDDARLNDASLIEPTPLPVHATAVVDDVVATPDVHAIDDALPTEHVTPVEEVPTDVLPAEHAVTVDDMSTLDGLPPSLDEPTPLPVHSTAAVDHRADIEETATHDEAAFVAASEPPPLPPMPHDTEVAAPVAPVPVKRTISIAAVIALLLGIVAVLRYVWSPLALLFALCTLAYLRPRPMLRGRPLAIIATVLSVVALGLWMHRPADAPASASYTPRPLKPLVKAAPATAAATPCATSAAAPQNDEDRFLLTGQRRLTGRAQRKGDTYVAEAAESLDATCQPSGLQLYVFHHGVFIGTALDKPTEAANVKLTDFDLVDDQHLRVTLAQCTDAASCAATTVRQFAVMPGGGGWTLGEMK